MIETKSGILLMHTAYFMPCQRRVKLPSQYPAFPTRSRSVLAR